MDPKLRPTRPTKNRTPGKFNRAVLIFAGHAFVGLGIIGAILPLMPTTVFLLLAAMCYARSSPRFYYWLMHNRYFGSYLRNYKEKKGTPLSVKISSISILWITILFSIWTTHAPWYVDALLVMVAGGVTIHLISIKTLRKD